MSIRARWGCVLALACAASGVAAEEECGAASPAEVYSRFQTYASEGRFDAMLGCLAPARRSAAAVGLWAAADFAVAMARVTGEAPMPSDGTRHSVAEMEEAYAAILEHHGMSDPEGMALAAVDDRTAEELLARVDRSAFVRDLMAFLETWGGGESSLTQVDRKVDAALSEVMIDGERAMGTVDGEVVYFVREDDLWYATDGPASGG